jgi:hypothetical protein
MIVAIRNDYGRYKAKPPSNTFRCYIKYKPVDPPPFHRLFLLLQTKPITNGVIKLSIIAAINKHGTIITIKNFRISPFEKGKLLSNMDIPNVDVINTIGISIIPCGASAASINTIFNIPVANPVKHDTINI